MAESNAVPAPGVLRQVPSALTDRQMQDIIDRAVKAERDRIMGVLRKELSATDRKGTGWSWEKWRTTMLNAINAVPPK